MGIEKAINDETNRPEEEEEERKEFSSPDE
jgi:hypothetical protein